MNIKNESYRLRKYKFMRLDMQPSDTVVSNNNGEGSGHHSGHSLTVQETKNAADSNGSYHSKLFPKRAKSEHLLEQKNDADRSCQKRCLRIGYIVCFSLVIVTSLVVGAGALFFPYPLHASCKIEWRFSPACGKVKDKIVAQMNQWHLGEIGNGDGCREGGQRCNYNVTEVTDAEIKGTHTTPTVNHFVDHLTITFRNHTSGTCAATGFSTSGVWYALLDFGTNYCNLNNLITGSGLNKDNNYEERTEDKVCTQYSKRNCDKY